MSDKLRRFLSFVMAFALLFECVPINYVYAEENEPVILEWEELDAPAIEVVLPDAAEQNVPVLSSEEEGESVAPEQEGSVETADEAAVSEESVPGSIETAEPVITEDSASVPEKAEQFESAEESFTPYYIRTAEKKTVKVYDNMDLNGDPKQLKAEVLYVVEELKNDILKVKFAVESPSGYTIEKGYIEYRSVFERIPACIGRVVTDDEIDYPWAAYIEESIDTVKEEDEPTEATEPIEEMDPTEVTEPVEETDPTEVTESVEETEIIEEAESVDEIEEIVEDELTTDLDAYSIAFASLDEPGAEDAKINISVGNLVFNDTDATYPGYAWNTIVRPAIFSFPITLQMVQLNDAGEPVRDDDGNVIVIKTVVPDNNGTGSVPNFLKMSNDGNGAGYFEIQNVPINEHIGYYLDITVPDTYPYTTDYPRTLIKYDSSKTDQTYEIDQIEFDLKTQTLELATNASDSTEKFDFTVNYLRPDDSTAKESKLDKKYEGNDGISEANSTKIKVPVGVKYTVTQTPKDGYALSTQYSVLEQEQGGEPAESVLHPGPVSGVIEKGYNTTITTSNYSSDNTYSFQVKWVDNSSPFRPEPAEAIENFKLMRSCSKDTEGNPIWEEVENPKCDLSEGRYGRYTFTDLASASDDGKKYQYCVVEADTRPSSFSRYLELDETKDITTDPDTKETVFTFRESVDFKATINWRDSGGGNRPTVEDIYRELTLKYKDENGVEQSLTLPAGSIKKEGNDYVITYPDLPRYNDNNKEYDYYLTLPDIPGYTRYYNNGTGNYAQDTTKCHNGGRIIEKVEATTSIQVTKKWFDNDAVADRPNAKLVLWRFAYDGETPTEIQKAIDDNVAAPVVYYYRATDPTTKEPMVDEDGKPVYESHLVEKDVVTNKNSETYVFDQLPMYDENGRRYFYFVRETGASDNYDVTYSGGGGAEDNGTVTNTRREKVAINVDKLWKCPANLGDLIGADVSMQVVHKDGTVLKVYSPDFGSYEPLTGDNANLTISGFGANIAKLSGTIYVNICDQYGHRYDPADLEIKELKIFRDGEEYTVLADGTVSIPAKTEEGEIIAKDDGSPVLDQFKTSSSYKEPVDGESSFNETTQMNEYNYDLTNTITGQKDYSLTKVWSLPKDVRPADKVTMTVTRTSTNPNASAAEKDVPIRSEVPVTKETNWTVVLNGLDKYDPDGYPYHYSAVELDTMYFSIDADGTEHQEYETKTMSELDWYPIYTRNEDMTTATNYKHGSGSKEIYLNKTWNDNVDTIGREDIMIRVYPRTNLHQALEGKSGDISLADLTGVPFAEYKLEKSKDWYRIIGINSIESLSKASGLDYNNIIVLEYEVGSGGQVAKYDAAELFAASAPYESGPQIPTVHGKIVTSNRQYNIVVGPEAANDRNQWRLVNTRTGQADLSVEKTWKDDGQSRPATIQFQLYRDDVPWYQVAGEQIPTIKTLDGTTIEGAVIDANGIITIPTQSEKFIVEDLPLFSAAGVRYSYSISERHVDEYITTEPDDYPKDTRKETDPPDFTHYEYKFINLKSGVTTHVAYKLWKDAASNGLDRPDLYFKLQRRVGNGEWEPYSAGKDPVRMILTKDNATDVELKEGFYMKVLKDDLPAYNEDGLPYDYEFIETMNNGGENAFGKYEQESFKHDEVVYLNDKPILADIYTNTLTGDLSLSGDKVWLQMEGYNLSQADYPVPIMNLFRSTTPDLDLMGKSQLQIEELVNDPQNTGVKIEFVQRTTIKNNRYSFPDSTDASFAAALAADMIVESGSEYRLPKYDSKGEKYYYYLWEQMSGAGNVDVNNLYTEINTNGTISNSLKSDINRREIQVTKTWDGRDVSQKYPAIVYELYRYVVGNGTGQGPDNAKLINASGYFAQDPEKKVQSPVTITAKQFQEAADGVITVVFDNLLIVSPKGEEYGYYVKEVSLGKTTGDGVDGYEVEYIDEEGTSQTAYADAGSKRDAIDSTTRPVSYIGTQNIYKPQEFTFNVRGAKYWDDHQNIAGLRPDSLKLVVNRYTGNQTEQTNGINSTTVELKVYEQGSIPDNPVKPYVVWTQVDPNGTALDTWTYEIVGLPKYGPNGMPYTYTISEQKLDGMGYGYPAVRGGNTVTPQVWMAATSGTVNLSGTNNRLHNKLSASASVLKIWHDGDNRYNLRPSSVTVILERKQGDGAWQTIPYDSRWGWDSVSYTDSDEHTSNVVGIKLTKADEVLNTAGNNWRYKFDNLPPFADADDPDGTKYYYRFREVAVGSVDLEEKGGVMQTEAYICERDLTTGSTASVFDALHNKLHGTDLVITKVWDDAASDFNSFTRPETLTFKLQKISEKTGDTWHDVMIPDGIDENGDLKTKVFEFELKASEDWTYKLSDLPLVEEDEVEHTYYIVYFRAVEYTDEIRNYEEKTNTSDTYVEKTSTGWKVRNEDSATGYDHYFDAEAVINISNSINELTYHDTKDISVSKTWYGRRAGDQATFELLYHIDGDPAGTWRCFGDDQFVSGTIDGNFIKNHDGDGCETCTSISTEEYVKNEPVHTWRGLPAKTRDGKALSYLVVEHALDETQYESSCQYAAENHVGKYSFTNIHLQNYSVQKKWINADYAAKNGTQFTSTFYLQKKVEGTTAWVDLAETNEAWNDNEGYAVTLSTAQPNQTLSSEWVKLPMYTRDGEKIQYRAVEKYINGVEVKKAGSDFDNGDHTDDYIVTYQYVTKQDAQSTTAGFADTSTIATNRMVYGYVNLAKTAAHLDDGKVTDDNKPLEGVEFKIVSVAADGSETDYATGIKTDANGNLSKNGTYGGKYLIPGKYKLVEVSSADGYSKWNSGVEFTVSLDGSVSTGEHGTAWISTAAGSAKLEPAVEYIKSDVDHSSCTITICPVKTGEGKAFNLESRGIVTFTKTASGSVKPHMSADGEAKVYFGIYVNGTQVAGMVASNAVPNGLRMELTDTDQNGTSLLSDTNPYLRQETESKQLTLASGQYQIKELVAPPGFKKDNSTDKVIVIPKIDDTVLSSTDNLSGVYAANVGKIGTITANEFSGDVNYQWDNNPNQVTLAKLDQYGRPVTLKNNGYLKLEMVGGGNFLTGENIIRLYQDSDKPATKEDGSDFAANAKPDIEYSGDTWIIRGLFDPSYCEAGKYYQISEPADSVPDHNIQAEPIKFTVDSTGAMVIQYDTATAKQDPMSAVGDDTKNYYKADAQNGNVAVLRDVARYLFQIELDKVVAGTTDPTYIPDIAFGLYSDANCSVTLLKGEYGQQIYLVTDSNGVIKLDDASFLEKVNDKLIPYNGKVTNVKTRAELRYGLDIAAYYLKEEEYGASDRYTLLTDPIKLEVKPCNPGSEKPEDLQDYAELWKDDERQSSKVATISNQPMDRKQLNVVKQDSEDHTKTLEGAEFTLTYLSINDGDQGALTVTETKCVTAEDGKLYEPKSDGTANTAKPILISNKGKYTLVETKAPAGYMTRTGSDGKPVTMLKFEVRTDNMVHVTDKYPDLAVPNADTFNVDLTGAIRNEKTRVWLDKLNDILRDSSIKSSDQKNLNGEPLSGAKLAVYAADNDGNRTGSALYTWEYTNGSPTMVEEGTLAEGTRYILHEESAPDGYLIADDITFTIEGTAIRNAGTADEKVVSKIITANNDNVKNVTLTMVDEVVIAPIGLTKTLNGDKLEGAVFEIKQGSTRLGTAVTNSQGNLIWKQINEAAITKTQSDLIFNTSGKRITAASNAMGDSVILRKVDGGYTVTEVYAPDPAHNTGDSFSVSITDVAYMAYKTNASYYVHIVTDNTAGELPNPPYESTVTLTKHDVLKPEYTIPGTEFTLYRKGTDNQYYPVTDKTDTFGDVYSSAMEISGRPGVFKTDKDGTLTITIKRKGDYKLVETAPAPGYEKDTLFDSNCTTFNLADADQGLTKTLKTDANQEFRNTPIQLKLAKQNADGNTLTGAEFTISGEMTKSNDPTVSGWPDVKQDTITGVTVDNCEELTYARLIPDKWYEITEKVAPDGYLCAATFKIKLAADGTIAEIVQPSERGSVAKDSTDPEKVNVTDEPTLVKIYKLADGKGLAGAVFTLSGDFLKIDGTAVAADSITWTSKVNADGTAVPEAVSNRLVVGNVYTLTEERVKDHEVLSNAIEFKLRSDGTVEIKTNSSIPNQSAGYEAATAEGINLYIQNPFIKGEAVLTKYKRNSLTDAPFGGDKLPGATFKLYRITDEHMQSIPEVLQGTFETGTDGTIRVKGLPEGRYYFIEVNAPEAYHINTGEKIYFEIHNDHESVAQWKKLNAEGEFVPYSADDSAVNGYEGKVTDTRINAQISLSKFNDSAPLTGATFAVEYRENEQKDYRLIGYLDEAGTTGVYTMTQGKFDGVNSEGLWRGFYRITELSAPDMMLNPSDATIRNTISFEIKNDDIGKTFIVKDGDVHVGGSKVNYGIDGRFITLTESGVQDTPIPTIDVKVQKSWPNDLPKTFQPNTVEVELWRFYIDANEQRQDSKVEISGITNPITLSAGQGWKDETSWVGKNLPAYFNDTSVTPAVTRQYTYYVKEVAPTEGNLFWYAESESYNRDITGVHNDYGLAADVKDGDMTANVINTMTTQPLTIEKTLGGGSDADEFQVRVKLTKGGEPVGNNGYYLDDYTLKDKNGTTTTKVITDQTNGWMIIKGGETISIRLPVGVTYEVEENAVDGYAVESNEQLAYVPRYLSGRTDTIQNGKTYKAEIRNAVKKTLQLTKNDGTNALPNAEFKVEYQPLNPATPAGAAGTATSWTCTTDAQGHLLVDGQPLDLTNQGTYTITETKAPAGYMTPTDSDGTPVWLAKVTVDSKDKMTIENNTAALSNVTVSVPSATPKFSSEAQVTVTNEKTVLYIDKLNDIAQSNNTKTADQNAQLNGEILENATLEIHKDSAEGELVGTNWQTGTTKKFDVGQLAEKQTYYLVETSVPVGYRKADPIKFQLIGTVKREDETVSLIQVWQNGDWVTAAATANVKNNTLTMVDEAVIAPVSLHKVLKKSDGTENLPGAMFEVKDFDSGTVLGTAKSTDAGLVWDSVKSEAISLGLIFNAAGKRIEESDRTGMSGKTIILKENNGGYTFRETYAPENAYMNGSAGGGEKTLTIKITKDNYKAYRKSNAASLTGEAKYNTGLFVDIVTADKNTSAKTASLVSSSADKLENPQYHSTVELTKYDKDPEAKQARIQGAQFTLYRKGTDDKYYPITSNTEASGTGQSIENPALFLTAENGKLEITIYNKGSYRLKETAPATGYLDSGDAYDGAQYDFELVDGTSAQVEAQAPFVHDGKATLKPDDDDIGFPNDRELGSITLVKVDAEYASANMNGVKFMLTRPDDPNNSGFILGYKLAANTIVEVGKKYTASLASDGHTWQLDAGVDGESGQILIENLEWATYNLVEVEEISGYILRNPQTYEAIVGPGVNPTVNSENGGNGKVPNYKNRLTVIKKGTDTDDQLTGATFVLYPVGTDGKVTETPQSFFTKENAAEKGTVITAGNTTVYGLPKGGYILHEIKAPDGYELAKDIFFELQADGTVKEDSVKTCTWDADKNVTKYSAPTVKECVVTNSPETATIPNPSFAVMNEPIKVSLSKELLTLNLIGTAIDATDRGAVKYKLTGYTADDKFANPEATEIVVNENYAELVKRLIGGHDYIIEELEAPKGFELRPEVLIHVNTDGTITIPDSGNGDYANNAKEDGETYLTALNTDSNGIAKLTFKDRPIELGLTKQSNVDPYKTLNGAVFEITGDMIINNVFVSGNTLPNITVLNVRDETRGKLIAGCSYTVTETKAPDGYVKTPSFTVEIDAYGNIKKLTKSNILVGDVLLDEDSKDTAIVRDDPTVVTFIKLDKGTQKQLAGAKFKLTAKDGRSDAFVNFGTGESGSYEHLDVFKLNAKAITWTSTETAGTITNMLIEGVEYKLEEIEEPSGYVRDTTEYKVLVEPNASGIYDVSVTVENVRNKVTFFKTDEEDRKLRDALFEVHEGISCDGCTPVAFYASEDAETKNTTQVSTDEHGVVTIYGLPTQPNAASAYHLVEITAPVGYEKASPVNFSIDRTGKVTGGDNVVSFNEDTGYTVTMIDKPIVITINKIGEKVDTKLSGADFLLTDNCGDSCTAEHKLAANGVLTDLTQRSFTTKGDDGSIEMNGICIAGHKYKLVETKAPDGYECTAEVTFEVKDDGTVANLAITGGYTPRNSNSAEAGDGQDFIRVSDEEIVLTLTKVDADSWDETSQTYTTKLAGVTFELKPADSSDTLAVLPEDNGTPPESLTLETKPDGSVPIPLLRLKHDHTYTLTETGVGPNTSYRLADNAAKRTLTFKVEKDGKLKFDTNPGMYSFSTENGAEDHTHIIAKNEKIKLDISKIDQATGANLSNVSLMLTGPLDAHLGIDSGTSSYVEWSTTDENAKHFFGLTPGEYTLEETENSNEKYNPISGSLTFTIGQNGLVSTAATVDSAGDAVTIAVAEMNGTRKQNYSLTNPVDGDPGKIDLKMDNAKYSTLAITKADAANTNTKLPNVEFQLRRIQDAAGAAVNVDEGTKSTNANGLVEFTDLPDSTYELTELKTAPNYNLLSKPLVIKIDRNGEVYEIEGTETGTLTRKSGEDVLEMTVLNRKGFELPATGTTTPQLPIVVLPITALLELALLYAYSHTGKRRKREGVD